MTDKQKSQEIANDVYIDWNDSTLATGAEYGAMKMAKWKDEQFSIERKQLIEKTCEWLEDIAESTGYDSYDVIEAYKKAMEE